MPEDLAVEESEEVEHRILQPQIGKADFEGLEVSVRERALVHRAVARDSEAAGDVIAGEHQDRVAAGVLDEDGEASRGEHPSALGSRSEDV